MNNKVFIQNLSTLLQRPATETQQLVQQLVKEMTDCLQTESSVIAIQGFGSFEVKKKNERVSVNPMTQQRMLVPPKLTLAYHPSPKLKDLFNSNAVEDND